MRDIKDKVKPNPVGKRIDNYLAKDIYQERPEVVVLTNAWFSDAFQRIANRIGQRIAVATRHVDEGLVDRKGDVQEVQAVDAEIVDGVAFRLDRLARNVAGLGDDIGHGVKSRRHQ